MKWWLLLLAFGLASCGNRDAVEVKQFTVREIDVEWNQDSMVRGEMQKRLYGAVSQEERLARRGQYYSIRWRARASGGPVKVQFSYRQASTGSRVQTLEQEVPAARTGLVEFEINGEAYQKGGRVTSWRAQVLQDGQILGQKQSFLWE